MEADASSGTPGLSPLTALRRFVRPRDVRERCELCDATLADEHGHMVEIATRRMVCACEACSILFSSQAAMKYRRIPRRTRLLADFRLTDDTWEGLQLPINLAFFLNSTPAGRVVALYPSPAGAMESLVTLEAWQALVADNPVLCRFEPDVEALLVNRIKETREYYRTGIDECYKLSGLIRMHWRGLSGGSAAWEEIDRFFHGLRDRST